MQGGEPKPQESTRTVRYCVVPNDVAPRLSDLLKRHFGEDSSVEVVIEQRRRARRQLPDRRATSDPQGTTADQRAPIRSPQSERRRIRARDGRRAGERRATLLEVQSLPLPRRAAQLAARLTFFERVELSAQQNEDIDTARLLTRIQSGEPDSFPLLYLRYFDRVYTYLVIALSDTHEAEDATQQVFLSVLQALPVYERRAQPFRAWLFTIVRHAALERLRKQGRIELVEPAELDRRRDTLDQDPGLPTLDWISDRELLIFVERLPLAQRQVLMLRYMLDLSNAQIAAVLDRTPNEVRVLQHRATRFLRDRLVALGRTPGTGRRARMARCHPKAAVLRSRRFALLP